MLDSASPPTRLIINLSSSFILCILDQHVQKDTGWFGWAFRCLDLIKPMGPNPHPLLRTPDKATFLQMEIATGQIEHMKLRGS